MSQVFKYVVKGEPIPLARVTEVETPRIWDDYKQKKFNYEQALRNQHDEKPFIDGPIELTIYFYMTVYPAHKHDELIKKEHAIQPSIFSLFNFCEHSLLGIIFKKECQIVKTTMKKVYDDRPRTEIRIKRVK